LLPHPKVRELGVAGEVGGAEVEMGVEFAFKQGRAAFGVADVIETFGDAEDGGEAAGDALVVVVERGVSGVVGVRSGLAIVIANDGGDDVAVAGFEPGDVAVEGEIFAMLVVAAMGDAMADVVKERAGFEFDASMMG
jgi:hypothetical protein